MGIKIRRALAGESGSITAGQLKNVLTVIASAVICLVAVSGAGAKVIPTMTTTLTQDQVVPTGTSGATTIVAVPANQLGQHSDLTVDMNFRYGATGFLSGGFDDPKTYPQPMNPSENLKTLVVDTPPGLVGNPNAVPVADRCDVSTFQTGFCPDSATVGQLYIHTGLTSPTATDATGATYLGIKTITPVPFADGFTKVSLLRTGPEVPALIGIVVNPPLGVGGPIRTVMRVAPVSSDLHLQTTIPDGIDYHLYDPDDGTLVSNFRIDSMKLKLFGRLANGNAFMTNSTNCQPWTTKLWAQARFFNDNADSDPLGAGVNNFKSSNDSTVIPDCTNAASVPFPASGTTKISSNARDVSPDFDFTVYNPGVQGNGQVSTSPKTVVTTVPASINVDVNQLNRTCPSANFDADNCPAGTRVGTVSIQTPLIAAGLSGDVYLVRRPEAGLPDLGLRIRGAINFTQRGHNRYVDGNKIQTTFDNIPQVGFSQLNVHLFGGPQGLLRTLGCPKNNKQPAIGDFNYAFTAYTGASASSTTKLSAASCFGIQKLRSFRCVYRVLRFQPTYTSRARIKNVVLYVDGKKRATAKRVPFQFRVTGRTLKKIKVGKHKIKLKATYDDKSVSVKESHFKRCGPRKNTKK